MSGSQDDERKGAAVAYHSQDRSRRAVALSAAATVSKPPKKAQPAPAAKSAKKPATKAGAEPAKKSQPKSSPNQVTVKTLTTALKPKTSDKPEATLPVKPAAKPARSAAVDVPVPASKAGKKPASSEATHPVTAQAPQATHDPAASEPVAPAPAAPAAIAPAAAKAAKQTTAKPSADIAATAPAPVPAASQPAAAQPAPQSHSGVISGPMRPMAPPRAMAKAENFADGDFVVYPTHGVGKVERIATEEIAGHKLELIHITFDENRMTLRVPTNKARTAGLRKLASRKQFDEVLATLKGRARIKRTMWSRRAQEYEAKINSGDPSAIAEVVRDLHRNAGQPDQSFSERQIYESALDRLAAEYAALEQVDKPTAIERLIAHLKSE
jgi:CarD family transcriptional regulator